MMRVLLVDDDTNFRRSLAIGLETSGCQVHEAQSGMEALEFLQANQKTEDPVSGVVIDARMPGLDGFWLADQITAMYPILNVIILSAHAYPSEIKGYNVLSKPVPIPLLIETLEQDMSSSQEES
jgi:CheY-like chemotaxis protein